MKKLFTIACPVILATLGVALLFIIRKKRKEKRLKRLRGETGFRGTALGTPDCVPGLPLCAVNCSLTKTSWFLCLLRRCKEFGRNADQVSLASACGWDWVERQGIGGAGGGRGCF